MILIYDTFELFDYIYMVCIFLLDVSKLITVFINDTLIIIVSSYLAS